MWICLVFTKWQRVVRLKYGLQPLSVAGSLKDPGGRFNIGDIDQGRYPIFPACYIAQDRPTALKEAFSVNSLDPNALAVALARPDSIVSFSLSGKLDSVLNLNRPERLQTFVDLIRTFNVTPHLRKRAQALRASLPNLISSVDELVKAVLSVSWRFDSMALDIPSPSQIFGQLVVKAGIPGILYPSKFSQIDCLAIFPQNFRDTDSFVELDDEAPVELEIRRLNADVWKRKESELCGRIE